MASPGGGGSAAAAPAISTPCKNHDPGAKALTKTYTSSDGTYSFNYPASWKLSTERGFPELSSPDGSVTGRVAPVSLLDPEEQFFAGPVLQYRAQDAPRLNTLLGTPGTLYSGYLPEADPAQDTVVWRLTNDNVSGMIVTGPAGSGEVLRADFTQSHVNRSGKTVSELRAGRIVDRSQASRKGATVEAILQSLQVQPDIPSAPGGRS